MATRKKKAPPANPQPEQAEGLEVTERIGILGARVHSLLSQIPKILKIRKADALEMHSRIDEGARLRSITYWLFMVASCGIATLGLIMNSPAVIIGAMLVSPLMSPIIGLGMGIATNDAYLTVKSIGSVVLGFALAVVTSALISFFLPLKEPTVEILSRTNPTVLDLFVALFCGMVASLSSVSSKGEDIMKDVAPGAAIGVALMPPLCVVGFGLGTGFNLSMMWGATLLFITNLMAIVLVSSVFYYFVYEGYDTQQLITSIASRRRNNEPLYSSRFRLLWQKQSGEPASRKRFWLPVVLLLAISYPLMTSFLFLKKKNDVRHFIANTLEKRIKGLQVIRGPESLTFTRQGVSGNILYSSDQAPKVRIQAELEKSIAEKFGGYAADVTLVRIAGASDLSALRKKEELNLETSRTTMHDRVRHAYAADLVRRAQGLLHRRFPAEWGIVVGVKISFGVGGIDTVRIDFRGRNMSQQTRSAVAATLRNELRELKGDVRNVVLQRVGAKIGSFSCAGGTAVQRRAEARIGRLLRPLGENPDLGLVLAVGEPLHGRIKTIIKQRKLKLASLHLSVGRRCAVRYRYKGGDESE